MCLKENSSSTIRIALAAAWAVLIFWMSAHTGGQMGQGAMAAIRDAVNGFMTGTFGIQGDSVSVIGHFTEYLVFGVLPANALRGRLAGWQLAVAALAIASLYGVTDEIHQIFVPGRYCDPADWLVDTIAAAIGASIFTTASTGRTSGTPS